jgi:hypothetical protein
VGNRKVGRRSSDGRQDFAHFWLFRALAAPWIAAARALGADPRIGFTVLNIALMIVAFAVAWRSVGGGPTILLLVGPIVWWSNKVHVEAFVVSLMMIALALWRDRPGTAMICAGLAAAQVPPLAVFVPMLAVSTVMRRPNAWRAPSFLAGLTGAMFLALLPLCYYFVRFGTLTLVADSPHWPSTSELGTVVWDLNIGLVPNWPLFAIAIIVALTAILATEQRRLLQSDIVMAVIGGLVLMLAFPQIGNFMHGATPGIIRYAVWLVPLAIPLFAASTAHPRARRTLGVIAVLSAALSLLYYHPAQEEFAHRLTALALWVWRHAPSWSHPSGEIFVRSLDQRRATVPVSTRGCDKILLSAAERVRVCGRDRVRRRQSPTNAENLACRATPTARGERTASVRCGIRSTGCDTTRPQCGRGAPRTAWGGRCRRCSSGRCGTCRQTRRADSSPPRQARASITSSPAIAGMW